MRMTPTRWLATSLMAGLVLLVLGWYFLGTWGVLAFWGVCIIGVVFLALKAAYRRDRYKDWTQDEHRDVGE